MTVARVAKMPRDDAGTIVYERDDERLCALCDRVAKRDSEGFPHYIVTLEGMRLPVALCDTHGLGMAGRYAGVKVYGPQWRRYDGRATCTDVGREVWTAAFPAPILAEVSS